MNSLKKSLIVLFFFVGIFISGCTKRIPVFIDDNFKRPLKLAVLPFENQTNDLEAGYLFRELFNDRLEKQGYRTVGLNEVDERLLETGISDGGQLASISNEEISKTLGVENLVYGTLVKCQYITIGIYKKKEVHGNVRIYAGGKLIWEDEASKSEKEFNLNPAKGLKEQLGEKLKEKALQRFIGHPFYQHIKSIVTDIVSTLPKEERN